MVLAEDTATRDETIEKIAKQLGVFAERGRRFAELTSLRVGGAIDWVMAPNSEEQAAALVGAFEQCKRIEQPYTHESGPTIGKRYSEKARCLLRYKLHCAHRYAQTA